MRAPAASKKAQAHRVRRQAAPDAQGYDPLGAQLLHLQQAAGNRAVNFMLSEPVQRQEEEELQEQEEEELQTESEAEGGLVQAQGEKKKGAMEFPPKKVFAGPGREALAGTFRTVVGRWEGAKRDAVQDFVADERHKDNDTCKAFVLALIGAPLTILSAGVAGPVLAGLSTAASIAVSVLSSVPKAPDPIVAFREQAIKGIHGAAEKLIGSRYEYVDQFLEKFSEKHPTTAEMKRALIGMNFLARDGVLMADVVRTQTLADLNAEWAKAKAKAEGARRHKAIESTFEYKAMIG